MESNKKEAIRAKMLAEEKLRENDVAGAQRFAFKAGRLYPELEGLSQFRELLDAHVASKKTLNGELERFGIFGADPQDDDETIRKRYKKLALALHPENKNSVVADEALKVVSPAWSVPPDKKSRDAYNIRLNSPATAATKRNYDRVSNSLTSSASSTMEREIKAPKIGDGVPPAGARTQTAAIPSTLQIDSGAHSSKPKTFWTSCKICKFQYEYVEDYRSQNILCRNCWNPFPAVEIPSPPMKDQMR